MSFTTTTTTITAMVLLSLALWAQLGSATLATSQLSGYADLPNPTSNLKTVPAGSLVIPMDYKQYSGSVFNIRAYGLAFYLLYANVPLYWSIAANKAKDAPDFTASAHQYWVSNSSSSVTSSVSFSAGPFVIHKSYAANALAVISAQGYTDVALYVLDANTTIDVRHTLLSRPKVLISDLSGYGSTIVNPLVAAGLVEGTHYTIAAASQASSVISSLNGSTYPVGGDVFDKSTKVIAWGGRILVVGFAGGKIPSVQTNRVLLKNCSVVGVFWGSYEIHQPHKIEETFGALTDMYLRGHLKPVNCAVYPLAELAAALKHIGSRRSYGKVIVQTGQATTAKL